MKTRFFVAIAFAVIMLACPLSYTSAESGYDSVATAELKNLTESGVKDAFNDKEHPNQVGKTIFDDIADPAFLNSEIWNNANISAKISDFDYAAGRAYALSGDGNETCTRACSRIDCDFELDFEMNNATKLKLIATDCEGDAVAKMVADHGQATVGSGDRVKINGHYAKTSTTESTYTGIFANGGGDHFAKGSSMGSHETLAISMTVNVNDMSYGIQFSKDTDASYDLGCRIASGDEKSYDRGIAGIASASADRNTSASGTMSINGKAYGYRYVDGSDGAARHDDFQRALPHLGTDLRMKVTLEFLPLLGDTHETSEEIDDAVKANGGITTTSMSVFDGMYESMIKSKSGEDYTVWITIGVLAAIVAAAFAVYYLRNRKPE